MDLLPRVREYIRRHDLIGPDTRVLAAVSGGSDSIALVHLLRALADAGELRLTGIAHFNHQLRPAADDDERFAAAIAASLDLPFHADREDVAACAARDRRSLEDAAHTARHAFFARARRAAGADAVALGHTRDDQAETVLLRLTRGAGPRGWSGMHPRNGDIVRPLLACRRGDLRAWLAERALPFLEDASNQDVSIPRNRIRAELLPLLDARFNPSIVDVLADQADLARDTSAWIDAMAAELDAAIVRRARTADAAPVCEIDAAGLRAAPLPLQRALLWRLMREVAGVRPIAFHHVEAARRLSEEVGGSRVDLPGQRVERIAGTVVLTGRAAGAQGREPADEARAVFRFPLSIPGEVVLTAAGWIVSADVSTSAVLSSGPGLDTAQVRRDLCRGALAVRNRRPGDRFRPVGLDGQKKLQDYFVDRKVPRNRRDSVPLVVDETDRIVWVAGFGIDEAFRVTDPAQAVIILKLRQA
ncbi:MAG: tRNA(Ile)-lysidine synthase [Acidobacteria bacterium]|nr:tRNA(Ile)-lysidine synthase [Acidobacteriota bacterium]